MTLRVTTANFHGAQADDVKLDVYETHACIGLGAEVGIWSDTECSLEAQLNELASIGQAIREQAMAELTRLANERALRALDASDA